MLREHTISRDHIGLKSEKTLINQNFCSEISQSILNIQNFVMNCILASEIGEQIAGVHSDSDTSRVVCCLQTNNNRGADHHHLAISETTSSSCGYAPELSAAPEIHRSSTISNSCKSSIGSHSVSGTLDCTWRPIPGTICGS
jgi:hypothetical protein